MADGLSIASSIAGIIALGSQVSIQLYQFIENVKSASSDVRDLAHEVTGLCSVLKQLRATFTKNGGLHNHQGLSVDLRNVLISCEGKLEQLHVLVKAHEVQRGARYLSKKWKVWSWALQEREVRLLRAQLEAHKATLTITLLLSTHTEALSVKDTADRIEETVKGISDMLAKNGDDDTDTVSRDKVLLQRYLSNASIRFCSASRSASPNPQGGLDGIVEESGQDGLVQKQKQRPEGGKRRKQSLGAIPYRRTPESLPTSPVSALDPGRAQQSLVVGANGRRFSQPELPLCTRVTAPLSPLSEIESRQSQSPKAPEDVQKTIEKLDEDFGFISEINRLYNESAKKRWLQLDKERGIRADKHERDTEGLYETQQIRYGELKDMDNEFKANEVERKAREEETEYRNYCSEVFEKVNERLQKEIEELMGEYLDIVKGAPDAVAGKNRWLKTGGLELAEMLEALLELKNHVEGRYEKVLAVTLERDHRQKSMVDRLLYARNDFRKMKIMDKQFKDNEKKTILKFAQQKFQRTQGLMGVIRGEGIKRGLGEELTYTDELTTMVNSLSARLSSPSSDLVLLRREITHDHKILRELKERAIRFFMIYYQGSLLVNEGIKEVALAEAELAEGGREARTSLQKEKISADQKASEDLQKRINLIESDFVTVERDVEAALDKLKVLEGSTVEIE